MMSARMVVVKNNCNVLNVSTIPFLMKSSPYRRTPPTWRKQNHRKRKLFAASRLVIIIINILSYYIILSLYLLLLADETVLEVVARPLATGHLFLEIHFL